MNAIVTRQENNWIRDGPCVAMRTGVAAYCVAMLVGGIAFSVPAASGLERPEHQLPRLHHQSTVEGTVARYLLDPRGEVEGLLLTDGTQLHVTSHIAAELIKAIKPYHRIRTQGTARQQPALFQPDMIVNMTTGTSFQTPLRVDVPPVDEENRLSMTPMRANGTIQALLYHDMTEAVHGMMLSDGTQVRLPPEVTEELRRSLRVGQALEVEGYGTENEYGRAMEALRLRIDHGRLIPLDATVKSLDEADQSINVEGKNVAQ